MLGGGHLDVGFHAFNFLAVFAQFLVVVDPKRHLESNHLFQVFVVFISGFQILVDFVKVPWVFFGVSGLGLDFCDFFQ